MKVVLVFLIMLVTTFVAGMALMGDVAHAEGPFDRAWGVWIPIFFGSMIMGMILPRSWYLSVIFAWYPILVGPIFFDEVVIGHRSEFAWWIGFNITFVTPIVALAGGYFGRLFRDLS